MPVNVVVIYIIASIAEMKIYVTVILICISMMINHYDMFSHGQWCLYYVLENIYSVPLLIVFKFLNSLFYLIIYLHKV